MHTTAPSKVADKVFFFERGTDRAPEIMGGLEVARKLKQGLLEIRAWDKRRGITAVQSSGVAVSPATLGARPGSYSIIREHLETGHFVFQHHNPEIDSRQAA